MNMLQFKWTAILLSIFSWLVACNEKPADSFHPPDQFYMSISRAERLNEKVDWSFSTALLIAWPEEGAILDFDPPPWDRIKFFGDRRTASVNWINDRCNSKVTWEVLNENAHSLIRSFYKELPLKTHEDVDEVLKYMLEAPASIDWDPSEPLPEEITNQTLEEAYYLRLTTPSGYLLSLLPQDDETQTLLNTLNYFNQRIKEAGWELGSTRLSLNLPEEAIKAKELVAYLEDFSNTALRAYLEKHKPECLVK